MCVPNGSNATITNSFYRLLAMDCDSWMCKLKLLSRVMASVLTVKAVAVFSESFLV